MNFQKTEKYFRKITQTLILVVISISTIFAASGDVDTTFNTGLVQMRYEGGWIYKTSVRKIIVQPDGKTIAIGNFRAADNYVRDGIARFNTDGSVDTTFQPPKFDDAFSANYNGNITAFALQNDGKIIIALNTNLGVEGVGPLVRLNSDGTFDPSFNARRGAFDNVIGYISDIQITPDNKIIFAGDFTYATTGNSNRVRIARLLSDGSVDLSFNPQNAFSNRFIQKIQLLSGGKILVASRTTSAGMAFLDRLNSDGSLDGSFTSNSFNGGIIQSIVVQADGKILAGGGFSNVNGFSVPQSLARFNENGSYDPSFNTGNAGVNISVEDIEILPNGRILIGGNISSYNGVSRQNIALLDSDGTLANTVVYTGDYIRFNDFAVQSDGKIIVGAVADALNGGIIARPFFRLNADATVDESYKPALGHFGYSRKIFVQSDGKILVGGNFTFADGKYHFSLVRLNQDGSTDEQFISPNLGNASEVFGIDVRADGKIAVGSGTGFSLLNSDGTRIFIALSGGFCPDMKFLPSGDILSIGNFYLRKLNGNTGQIDFSFNVQANSFIRKVKLQSDGKILITGDFTSVNGVSRSRIARLNADGTVDTTFNPLGGANGNILDFVLQPDGKILIGGEFTGVNFDTNRKYLARLNSDGSLDTSFTPTVNNVVSSLKIQPNGKILIGGLLNNVNGVPRNNMARLNANGTFDPSFNLAAGTDGNIWSIDLQADNKIIIGGDFRYANNLQRIGLARLLNNSVQAGTLFDFDGDRRTDIAIFRPNVGQWWYLRSSDNSNRAFQFGSSTDKIVPADFTGDGKTDIAIFKPSSGEWFILRSEDSSFYSFPFGTSGDIPVAADFDGDGKADPTIFRPSNSTWYSLNSNGGTTIRQFGINGDLPVVGDYDGDGKADLSIFRPSNGQWWINRSASQTTVVYSFGTSTDKLVPADYTGDGKTDVAFFRPSSGEWFILRSENASFYSFPFGSNGDIPAAGDYDGDGKADAAVFRNSNTTWYLNQSTSGFSAVGFGLSGDKPVPSAYIP